MRSSSSCRGVRRSSKGNLSGVGLQWSMCPLFVVFPEKGLSKLITADHDGTGWSHFYHPGEKT